MKKIVILGSVVPIFVVVVLTLACWATDAEMYFASDLNGQNRVTSIQEGDEIWICVYDPDENINCDFQDKIFTDIRLVDPKTNAWLAWNNTGDLTGNYLEETGGNTGLFVSNEAFAVGARRADWSHGTGDLIAGADLYLDGIYTSLGEPGRVENMDTLVGLYQDPNDTTDVVVAMAKIIDTKASISWNWEIYENPDVPAIITIVDPDENLNCNEVEYVPVFIIVNPGSWNPVDAVPAEGFSGRSATNFCMLKRYGGVNPADDSVLNEPIRWYNIYNSGIGAHYPDNAQPTVDGAYYIEYPIEADGNVVSFETTDPDGFCRVMFYARETGFSTGVFQLHLNNILSDLGFDSLSIRDVLVAYYLDPNDFDDFALSTAYIEEHQHSVTGFTDATRNEMSGYWLGRDAVHVQVIDSNANVNPCAPEQVVVHICDPHGEDDAEWIILNETSSNSPVFFNNTGTQLRPVWDASGLQVFPGPGGYQLQLDNWRFEAYNEDSVYARYNDVYYINDNNGIDGLGDTDPTTAFPPLIGRVRVGNDVSFDTMEVGDTQVFDASTGSVNMYFLDRGGNKVSYYLPSDCAFIEVVDPDQNEDESRADRVDAYWDGSQPHPYGLPGIDEIFGNPGNAKVFVANPRNGRWAAVDLLEAGPSTGDFVSVTCVDLVSVYPAIPTLGVLPGDTILAYYQDPSNHSDFGIAQIKVYPGGPPPGEASTTEFVDPEGNEVPFYTEAEDIYVKVIDSSHAGAVNLLNAVAINGNTFDLSPLIDAPNDTFITDPISQATLGVGVGDSIIATYTDPTDPTDSSSDTITIIASGCTEECTTLTPAGWHMTSIPGDLCGPCWDDYGYGNLCCAICNDIDPCYIFRYDPDVGGYVMVPPCDAIDYQAGMGFWVRTYTDPVEICADVTPITETLCIPLEVGWNQVGSPFFLPVPLIYVTVRHDGDEVSLQQAQANGWVSMYLFSYDPTTGGYGMVYLPDGVLYLWTGYWFRAYEKCELCIPQLPPPPSSPGASLQPMDLDFKNIPTPPPPPSDPMEAISEDLLTELVVQNIPNPVRSEHTTTFKVEGKTAELVQAIRVEIYNQAGQRVFTQEIGAKELEWHTDNDTGELLANGVYLYQVWVRIGDTWHPTGVRKLAVCR